MKEIFKIAASIKTPLALAGLIFAIFFLVLKLIINKNIFPKLSKNLSTTIFLTIINRLFKLSILAIVFGFMGFIFEVMVKNYVEPKETFFHLRVTLLNPQGLPVENGKIWTSLGGEEKKFSGGWQIDIPVSIAKGKNLIIYCSNEKNQLFGIDSLLLSNDYNPNIVLKLKKDVDVTNPSIPTIKTKKSSTNHSSRKNIPDKEYSQPINDSSKNNESKENNRRYVVRGHVSDKNTNPIPNAKVYIEDLNKSTYTDTYGFFIITVDQFIKVVTIKVCKEGYNESSDTFSITNPIEIILERKEY